MFGFVKFVRFYSTKTEWKTVYRFKYIRHVTALSKLKLYAAGTTAAAIPGCGIPHFMGTIDPTILPVTLTIGVSSTLALAAIGLQCNNLIGLITANNEDIKISYLNIWGRRQDMVIPLDDVIPLSEINRSYTDSLYVKLCRYSTKDIFKLNLHFGEILDRNKLEMILGEVK